MPAQEQRCAPTCDQNDDPGSTRELRPSSVRASVDPYSTSTTACSRRRTRAAALSTTSFVMSPRRVGASRAVPNPSRGPEPSTAGWIRRAPTPRVGGGETAARLGAPPRRDFRPPGTAHDNGRAHGPPSAISQSPACGRCMSHRGAGPRRSRRLPDVGEVSGASNERGQAAPPARPRRRRGDWRLGRQPREARAPDTRLSSRLTVTAPSPQRGSTARSAQGGRRHRAREGSSSSMAPPPAATVEGRLYYCSVDTAAPDRRGLALV